MGEPPSLWQQHRGAALTAGAVLVLQGATIGGLLWQRRRRRQAESDAVGHRLELASATRLAVMGELSAAIAHEVRQPLGAILSNAEAAELLLDADRPDLAQLREILADIRRDDLRAHEVIRRLRRLFQAQQVEHVPLSLHETLDEALRLLAPEALARGVHIERHFDAQHDVVLGDRIQLQQVLVNLVRNAMDAMEHLAPELRQLGVATAELAGGTVLRVSDAGHGIASAHRQRLFTSFFTTKPHGMGMGLSIVHSLVEAHQGTVHAETGNGRGAVFVVWLPLPAPADTSLLPAQPQPVRRAA